MPPKKQPVKITAQDQLVKANLIASIAFDPKFLIESVETIWRKLSLIFICEMRYITNYLKISSSITAENGKIIVQILPRIIEGTHIRQLNLPKLNAIIREIYNKRISDTDRILIEIQIQDIQVVPSYSELNQSFVGYTAPSSLSLAQTNSDKQKILALLQNEHSLPESTRLIISSLKSDQTEVSMLITKYLFHATLGILNKIVANLRPSSNTDVQMEIDKRYNFISELLRVNTIVFHQHLTRIQNLFPLIHDFAVRANWDRHLSALNLSTPQYDELKIISKKLTTSLQVLNDIRNSSVPENYRLNEAFSNFYLKCIKLIDCNFHGSYIVGLGTQLSKEYLTTAAQDTKQSYDAKNTRLEKALVLAEGVEILDSFCKFALDKFSPQHHKLLFLKAINDLCSEEVEARKYLEEGYLLSVNSIVTYQRQILSRSPHTPPPPSPHESAGSDPARRKLKTKPQVTRALKAEQSELARAEADSESVSPQTNPEEIFTLDVSINGNEMQFSPANNLYSIGTLQNIYVTDLGLDFGDLSCVAERGFIGRNSRAINGFKQHYPEWIALKRGDSPHRFIFVSYQVQGKNIYIPCRNCSHSEYQALIDQHRENQVARTTFLQQALRTLNIQEIGRSTPTLSV